MKTNDIRVGNWVLVPNNNEVKIPAYPKQVKGITIFGELDFTEPTYQEPHVVSVMHCGGVS